MYVSTKRLIVRMPSVLRSVLWLGLGLALALSAQTGLGQDDPDYLLPRPEIFRAQGGAPPQDPEVVSSVPPEPQTQFGDNIQDGLWFGDQFTGRSGEAYGTLFRASVYTGPGIGRTDTIVPLEIMPYGFVNNAMVFGSLRGFRAAQDGWGMNLGGGMRYYSEKWDRIWGANAYYDYDNSSGGLFREVGFGLESLGSLWDMRANAYIPTGKTERLLKSELVQGSQRFVDHRLLYDNLLTFGNALRGVDWELGVPIPGRVPQRHDLKVFGGFYIYSGSSTKDFAGWKIRAQANVVQNVMAQLEVTDDTVFDTTVVFGAAWTYGGFKQPEDQKRTQFDRMTEMVRRNYNVVVAQIPILDPGKVAINPITNQPYFFEHVASYAPAAGMDGTVNHPWQTLTQAETALNAILPNPADQAGNIIYVHANSVYTAAPDNVVTLIPSVRILGEGNGVQHIVRVPVLGGITLPRATNFPNRPIFSNQTGNAVTLVSGTSAAPSEFSGFQIGNPAVPSSGPTGIGIIGDGVGNVVVNQTDVNFAQGDGVFLNNMNGPVAMLGTVINNVGNTNTAIDGLHIVGGNSRFVFGVEPVTLKRSAIENTGGYALVIDGTSRGSTIDMTGSDITDGVLATATTPAQTGGGILLNDIDGVVIVDSATIVNTVASADTTGRAIDIEGTAATPLTPAHGLGQISFVGGIAIDNPQGDAIHVQNMQSDSTVTPNLISNVRFILPNPVNGVLAPGIRITNRNSGGINLLHNAGNVSFLEPVSISTNAAPLQAAINYQFSTGTASFLSLLPSSSPFEIQISGGGGNGIEIGTTTAASGTANGNSAQFRVTGATNIQSVAGTSIQIGDPTAVLVPPTPPITLPAYNLTDAAVTFGDVSIDNRGQRGIQVIDYSNGVQFTGTTIVANALNSQASAVDIRFNRPNQTNAQLRGDVSFTTLNIQQAQGPVAVPITTGAGLNIVNNPAGVAIRTLDINQNSLVGVGTALFVDDAGTRPAVITTTSATPTNGLSVTSGNIFSQGGPAAVIQNSVINMVLNSINSTNSSADGITLINNVGVGSEVLTNGTTIHPTIFSVTGQANILGSGGLVQGSTGDGIYIENSEAVQLKNMDFIGNHLNGISATTPSLTLLNERVSGNDGLGVNVYAVAVPLTAATRTLQTVNPFFSMQGSTITGNGVNAALTGSQEVLFTASTLGTYTVVLGGSAVGAGNTINHAFTPLTPAAGVNETRGPAATATAPTSNDGILVRTQGAAIGSVLNLTAVQNNITVSRLVAIAGPLSDMQVNWNGAVTRGTIESNVFNFGADGGEGLVLNLPSTSLSSTFRIAGNTFNSPLGIGTTGIDVTTNGGNANIQIGSLDGLAGNVMNFIEPAVALVNIRPDDEGMRFTLGANSNVNIFNNQINMQGLDLEGIQFASVVGPSTVTMNNNTIDLNGGLLNLFGIRILNVASGTLNLGGVISNDITINGFTGSTFPWFFAPATGISGQTTINGVLVP